ncbi:MAG: ribonuclease P protein component [Myxococcaceae bacterium]
MSQRFPKALRLRKRREFLKVQEGGVKISSGPLLALALARKDALPTRLGITVSTKVGPAVLRTRLRRKIREWFRKAREELPGGLDLLVIARKSAADTRAEAFDKAFDAIALQLGRRFA